MDVGQPKIAALESVDQPFMVDTQAVQQSRVQIVNMNGLVDDVVAEVIGIAVNYASLYASTSEPHREIPRVMVTPIVVLRQRSLAVHGAAELSTPNHERIFE